MRKIWYRRILIYIAIITTILGGFYYGPGVYQYYINQEASTDGINGRTVLLGGMPVGVYLKSEGVLVLAAAAVQGIDGYTYNPAENLVKPGDYIVAINGKRISAKEELIDALSESKENVVILDLVRNGEKISVRIQTVCVGNGDYKLGIWVRDDTQGLGTITYLTQDNWFGALGHGIHDMDTNELLSISEGSLYAASLRSVIKSKAGRPGSLEGIIVYNQYNKLGDIYQNKETGIYGKINKIERLFIQQIPVETGRKNEIKTGPAQIRCSIDGNVEYYDIEITEIDLFPREINKGLMIRITDKKLLEKCGGIVQGMSGSPIIQDGKLIGAVTHVLVNDPTRGYGIFIENMLDTAG